MALFRLCREPDLEPATHGSSGHVPSESRNHATTRARRNLVTADSKWFNERRRAGIFVLDVDHNDASRCQEQRAADLQSAPVSANLHCDFPRFRASRPSRGSISAKGLGSRRRGRKGLASSRPSVRSCRPQVPNVSTCPCCSTLTVLTSGRSPSNPGRAVRQAVRTGPKMGCAIWRTRSIGELSAFAQSRSRARFGMKFGSSTGCT